MQSELPLWSSGLESLRYSDPFPMFPNSASASPEKSGDRDDTFIKYQSELSGTDEEKGWRFYIGSICNRRTVNDMLIDMWRRGESEWINNMPSIVKRSAAAAGVVYSWYANLYPISVSDPETPPASLIQKKLHLSIHSLQATGTKCL